MTNGNGFDPNQALQNVNDRKRELIEGKIFQGENFDPVEMFLKAQYTATMPVVPYDEFESKLKGAFGEEGLLEKAKLNPTMVDLSRATDALRAQFRGATKEDLFRRVNNLDQIYSTNIY